jgi:hypothetical protein
LRWETLGSDSPETKVRLVTLQIKTINNFFGFKNICKEMRERKYTAWWIVHNMMMYQSFYWDLVIVYINANAKYETPFIKHWLRFILAKLRIRKFFRDVLTWTNGVPFLYCQAQPSPSSSSSWLDELALISFPPATRLAVWNKGCQSEFQYFKLQIYLLTYFCILTVFIQFCLYFGFILVILNIHLFWGVLWSLDIDSRS